MLQSGTACQVFGTVERRLLMMRLADSLQPGNVAQPQLNCRRMGKTFKRAVVVAGRHVETAHFDAMSLGVLHELARTVEAQRLRVQHGGEELCRVVVLDPARRINQQREAGCVAFRKAVLAEAMDLLEICSANSFA